jgi:hypothetical protein
MNFYTLMLKCYLPVMCISYINVSDTHRITSKLSKCNKKSKKVFCYLKNF